jgi:orotate phosphoribosyltransferase
MTNQASNLPLSAQIAAELLEIKAIKLQPENPFTWASGWKSPIYCDNRMTLSYPALRTLIKDGFVNEIKNKYPQTQVIAGVATAGIPQGALIAEAMELPFIYVRDKAKSHGRTNRIEGEVQPGKNVFVVEDLISTGGSAIKAIDALREAKMNVLGLGAIFTYGFPQADRNLLEANVSHFCLSDYHSLLDIAASTGLIDASVLESLNAWRMNPESWMQ